MDELSLAQPIVFVIGQLTVAFPAVTKTWVVLYSPLTGHVGRLGLGAAMGATRPTAVVIGGDRAFPIADVRR